MSTDPRLFIGQDLAAGQAVALPKEDTHYLVNVMRRAAGDTVRLFNGRDGEWRAQIVETGRKAAILEPLEQTTRLQAGVPDLWLLFAPVKRQKDRSDGGEGDRAGRGAAVSGDNRAHAERARPH